MKQKRWVAPAAITTLLALIAVGSSRESWKHALHTQGRFHLLAHFATYTVAGVAVVVSARRTWVRLVLVLTLCVLALSTEYGEHLNSGWPIEQNDLQQDALGIAVGAATGWIATWALRRGITERT